MEGKREKEYKVRKVIKKKEEEIRDDRMKKAGKVTAGKESRSKTIIRLSSTSAWIGFGCILAFVS